MFTYTDHIRNATYTYYYDYAERLTDLRGSDGTRSRIEYDEYGRVSACTDSVGGTATTTEYIYGDAEADEDPEVLYGVKINGTRITAYEYDKLSRLDTTRLLLTTPFETRYTYLDNGSLTSTQVESMTNGGSTLSYTYDANGNILTISENSVLKASYTYDAQGQLIREDNAYLGNSITYAYDAGGNLLNKKQYAYTTGTLGTVQSTVNYTYGDSNWGDKLTAYNGKAITYDAIGNAELEA